MTAPARAAPARAAPARAAPARGTAPRTATPARPARSAPARRRGSGSGRARSAAVERAYARRAQRTDRWLALAPEPDPGSLTRIVVLIMVLLSGALVATLWLSTAATADSYRLQEAQAEARHLAELSERLNRQVATLETAPQLARRARELGMVPADEPARLVVRPDGTVTVMGTPTPATAPPRPDPPPRQPDPPPAANSSPSPEPGPPPAPAPGHPPTPEPPPAPQPGPEPEQQAMPPPGQPTGGG